MAYQPLSSAQYLSQVQSNAKPLPVNNTVPGIMSSLIPKAPSAPTPPAPVTPPVGIKTKSPQDNIKTPTNTTPQPQTQKPASAPSSTENGTQNTGTYYNPNAGMQAVTGTPQTPTTQPTTTSTGYQPNDNGLYGKLVTDLANRSTQSGKDYQDAQAEAQRISDQQTALSKDYAEKTHNIAGTAGFLTQQNGEQGLLNNQYNTVQNALSSQYAGATNRLGAANTQQGLMQQALQSATGASAPQMQFGQLSSPVSGAPITSGNYNSNPQLQSAVQQAVQLVQNGASQNDPSVQSLLSTFGLPGQAAFTQSMQQVSNGTYNPTALNTQVATNQSQGATYQQQATQMDTALKQLDTITPTVTNFLASSGLNSQDNPGYNSALNTYYGQFLNPGNKQIFEQYIGDIKKYTGQILAAGSGSIPTDTANTLASFDPSNLSVAQLVPYLDNLSKLGNNQLSVLQKQSTSSYGGTGGYSGTPATATTNPTFAPNNQKASVTTNNPVIQGLIGGGLNILGGVEGAISGFAHSVLK